MRCALPNTRAARSCARRASSASRPWSNSRNCSSAAEHVMEDKDTEEDLRLLFAPGSSLGGARPKASVIEKDGQLAIAKFPRKDDEINTVVWEAVALALAKKAGIAVPRGPRRDRREEARASAAAL